MKKQTLAGLLILSCGMFMGLKVITDQIPREKVPGASIIYIPSGKHLKYASFGYSTLLADLVYIWAVQYFSSYSVPERFQYLTHVFSITSDLDPKYLDPYQVGALIAIYDAKDFEAAMEILEEGLKKNPDQWIFPWQAGHYAQMILKDYELAKKYYKKAMEIEGSPPITRRLYSNAAYELGDYKTAWENWLEIYQNTDDERVKKIASNHLYRTKAALDIQIIEQALKKYKNQFGQFPEKLESLVSAGLLDSIPQDLDGQDYVYDRETGEVKTAVIPWKR
ncbi:MAG: tetratricopeptide repeat protein [Acidobacteriota bacterium]